MKTTYREFSDIFDRYNHPSEIAIRNPVDKFESTGSVHNIPATTCVRLGRSAENIVAVNESQFLLSEHGFRGPVLCRGGTTFALPFTDFFPQSLSSICPKQICSISQ